MVPGRRKEAMKNRNLAIAGALLTLTLMLVFGFQNCSSGFGAADSSVSQTSVGGLGGSPDPSPNPNPDPTPSPNAGPNPDPSPSPSPQPMPGPQPAQRIPSRAILDVLPKQAVNPFCPAGYQLSLHGTYCEKVYNGEANPTIISEIQIYNGNCPAGFVQKQFPTGLATDVPVCVKFEPANQATAFISEITFSSLCGSWQTALDLPGQNVKLCHALYDNLGSPRKAISSLYLATTSDGNFSSCNPGDRTLIQFWVGGNTAALNRGSPTVCAGYADATNANATILESVATPGEGQACPAGHMKIGDMRNLEEGTRNFPLCAKFNLRSGVQLPLTSFYRAFTLVNPTTAQKKNCAFGETVGGEAPVFHASRPVFIDYVGLGNLCVVN